STLPYPVILLLLFLRSAYAFFSETSILRLMFAAAVLSFARRYEPTYAGSNPNHQDWPRRIGVGAFLGFGLYRYLTTEPGRAEFIYYMTLGVRGVLCLVIVEGAAATLLPASLWLWSSTVGRYQRFRRRVAERRRQAI